MSFVIQCPTCQTQLSIGESMSGQQVRCPKCSTILAVGALPPNGAVAAPAGAKSRPPAAAAAPRAQPKPAAAKSVAGVKKTAPARAPQSTEVVDLPVYDEKPQPRGSGSRFGFFLIVFVVGIGGGGAAAYYGFPYVFKTGKSSSSPSTSTEAAPKPLPDDLVFMPDHCQLLASATVPKLFASTMYKEELKRLDITLEKSDIEAVFRLTGVLPDEIERLTFGAVLTDGTDPTKKPEWILVVRSSKPPRVDDLKTGTGETDAQPVTIGKQTIYRTSFGGAVFIPVERERTVVLGSSANVLKSVINRDGPTSLPEGLKAAYRPLNDSWGLWLGIDATAVPSFASVTALLGLNPTIFKRVQAVVLESPADKPFDFQIVVQCKDETDANATRDPLNAWLGILPPVPPTSLLSMFNSARFETIGNRIAARISVRTESLKKLVAELRWEIPEFWIVALADKSTRARASTLLTDNPQQSIPFLIRALQKDETLTDALIVLGEMKEKGKTAAPAVARLMTHPRTGPRLDAVKALAAFGPSAKKEVLAALLQGESDSDDGVRLAAQRARAQLGPLVPEDAESIAAVFKNTNADARARASALQAWAVLAPTDPMLVPTLLDTLKDKAKELRVAAILTLGKVAAKQRETVYPAFAAALKDDEQDVRTAAAAGLEMYGVPTEKECALLLALFKEANAPPFTMAMAAKLLAKAGPAAGKDAFAAFLGGLSHTDEAVRGACVAALAALPPPAATELPILLQQLEDVKSSAETKHFVLDTLNKLGDKLDRTKAPNLGRTLLQLSKTDAKLAEKALQAFAFLGAPTEAEVPALMELMKDPMATAATRGSAARALAPLGTTSPEIAKVLLVGLSDMDAAIRRLSAEGLAKAGLKTPEAVQAFAKALEDKDAAIRLNVTTALVAMPPAIMTYPHILRAYEDEDEAVRNKAIEGLKRVEKPDVPTLIAALMSPHLRTRLFALSILAEQKEGAGAAALEALAKAARDDSATVRLLALSALAASGADPQNITPTLVNALKDMSVTVQMAALEALVKLKQEPKVVVPLLLTAAGDKNNPGYEQAVKALGQLGDWAKEVRPQLLTALQKEETRGGASLALASMGKEGVKDLNGALEKAKDPALVIVLLETLAKIGPDARPALPEVLKRINSANAEIKTAAKAASVAIQKAK